MKLIGGLSAPLNSYAANYKALVRTSGKSKWEDRFRAIARGLGVPKFEEHYRFHPVRRWEFDFAWPEKKIAFEMEGAIWMRGGGGHSHPIGIERDIEKYNAAALLGWRVIRITGKMLPVRKLFQDEAARLLTEILTPKGQTEMKLIT